MALVDGVSTLFLLGLGAGVTDSSSSGGSKLFNYLCSFPNPTDYPYRTFCPIAITNSICLLQDVKQHFGDMEHIAKGADIRAFITPESNYTGDLNCGRTRLAEVRRILPRLPNFLQLAKDPRISPE